MKRINFETFNHRYYIILFIIILLFFGNLIIHDRTPFVDSRENGWNADFYHMTMMLYKKGESLYNGFEKWDFNNSFGVMNTGYLAYSDLNIFALLHYTIVAKFGFPLYKTYGWIIFTLLLFTVFSFYYYLHDCLHYNSMMSLMGSLLLFSNNLYFSYSNMLNYSGIFFFFPLALICIDTFFKNPGIRNGVILAIAIAFPAYNGMFNVYANYISILSLTIAVYLIYQYAHKKKIVTHVKFLFFSFSISILLNIYFWLPFIWLNLKFPVKTEYTVYESAHRAFLSINPLQYIANYIQSLAGYKKHDIHFLLFYSSIALVIFTIGLIKSRFKPAKYWYTGLILISFIVYYFLKYESVLNIIRIIKPLKFQAIIALPFIVILMLEGFEFISKIKIKSNLKNKAWIGITGLAVIIFQLSHSLNILRALNYVIIVLTKSGKEFTPFWRIEVIYEALLLLTIISAVVCFLYPKRINKYIFSIIFLLAFSTHSYHRHIIEPAKNSDNAGDIYGVEKSESLLMKQVKKENSNYRAYYTEDFGFLSDPERLDYIAKNIVFLNKNPYFNRDYDLQSNSYNKRTRIRYKKMFWNNFATIIPSVDGSTAFITEEAKMIFNEFYRSLTIAYGFIFDIENPLNPIYSNMFGLKYIISPFPINKLKLVYESPESHWRYIHETPDPRPVIQFPERAYLFKNHENILNYMQDAFKNNLPIDEKLTLTTDEEIGSDCVDCIKLINNGNTIKSISYGKDEINIMIEANSYGYLEVNQALNKYWNAEIDGRKGKLLRTNYLFRLIPIRKSDKHIRLYFYMPIYTIAGIINIIAILLCIYLLFFYQNKFKFLSR
ncbi:MAG: hypothetical protein HOC71_01855 [Candidatus Latescibacteria bacterium]|nr:hypothetical protein [Candidatus Latescibacterota bacterium]